MEKEHTPVVLQMLFQTSWSVLCMNCMLFWYKTVIWSKSWHLMLYCCSSLYSYSRFTLFNVFPDYMKIKLTWIDLCWFSHGDVLRVKMSSTSLPFPIINPICATLEMIWMSDVVKSPYNGWRTIWTRVLMKSWCSGNTLYTRYFGRADIIVQNVYNKFCIFDLENSNTNCYYDNISCFQESSRFMHSLYDKEWNS